MVALKNVLVSSGLAGLALAAPQQLAKRGSVPIDGKIITSCTTKGVVALTFDDGPYQYTQSVVTQLNAAGQRATFFQNGNNWDLIYNYNATIKNIIAGGHQIGSHTWSHMDLGAQTDATVITSQMTQLEVAYMNILGYYPTYMRPPYLSTSTLAINTLKTLLYKIIEVDIDTQDWAEDPLGDVQLSIQWYEGNQTAGGTLSLNHDVYEPTADTFLPTILAYLKSKNLQSVTVGECLGDDPINWYRNTRTGWSSVSSSSSAHSSTSSAHSSSSSKPASSSSSSRPASASASASVSHSASASVSASVSHSASASASVSHSASASVSHSASASVSHSASASASVSHAPSVSPSASVSSTAPATPSGVVSPDWSCGGTTGYICPTGNCCSPYGWCGSTSEYCGMGCQAAFGTCTAGAGSTGGTTTTGTIDVTGGTCGGTTGFVCGTGECCSQYGYCGTGTSYCS